MDMNDFNAYEKAYTNKLENMNTLAWQIGIYVQCAIGSCLDSNAKYPEKPIDFRNSKDSENYTEEEIEQARKDFIDGLKAMEIQFNSHKNKGKE